MSQIEKRLAELNLALPQAPGPGGNYLPYRISGNQLFLAGVVSMLDGKMTHSGKVGDEQTEQSGYEAARVCTMNALANIKAALGSLDRVTQFLLVTGYVNAVPGYANSPKIINGASDLLGEVFGESGKHARAAIAVNGLPGNATVELQIIVEFEDSRS